ncbi:MAG: hypothetical protein LBK42_09010 [Propionibacteriaceae bacterium]|jgi:hypothetical protein|nr:hypothetical protein [Propionibacteriaceae bacterium]
MTFGIEADSASKALAGRMIAGTAGLDDDDALFVDELWRAGEWDQVGVQLLSYWLEGRADLDAALVKEAVKLWPDAMGDDLAKRFMALA